jgi:FemAB-related protein (PEP-CTERM system-associated)
MLREYSSEELEQVMPRFADYFLKQPGPRYLSRHPAWLMVLQDGLQHTAGCIEAVEGGSTRGILPLAFVRSMLFGRFLVSLPYVNSGGPLADDENVAKLLIDRAVEVSADLRVSYLELRHEKPIDHPLLSQRLTSKVHVRRALPKTADELWKQLHCKVRNQVRKGEKCGLSVAWGSLDLLSEFYAVFSQNMRDLGTPVYGRHFFHCILTEFAERAELCVVRLEARPVAAALLLHGWGVTEVPSASSLRRYNSTCANMLMYWQLLKRAIERGQHTFDFGRSTRAGSTHRFKQQWGATEFPAEWQYHVRSGSLGDMRPENPKYAWKIRVWQRLPVTLTRWLGPAIVRGIP